MKGTLHNTMLAAAALLTTTAAADTVDPRRTSVHDPSVVVDTITQPDVETFYVFGSHMGVSQSADLVDWTSDVTGGERTSATLWGRRDATGRVVACSYNDAFRQHEVTSVRCLTTGGDTVTVALEGHDAAAYQGALGNTVRGMMWAPDVIWNPTMQKWLLYMGINGDDWCSVIVCMAADKVEGPYVYQGPVCYSGFDVRDGSPSYHKTDLELVIGEQATLPSRYQHGLNTEANWGFSWGDYWPNNIDPCVFYDDEGRLRMVYGSWSGGIFMLDLDETTGLRDYTVQYPVAASGTRGKDIASDPYFGRRVAGGWYVSGEGAYVKKIGQWWYLFVSYGGFAPDGGYEMRVFRAVTADGPYVDCTGRAATYTGAWAVNYGKNETDHRGQKLMGGYWWPEMPKPELAQGHNSVATDREGRTYVVYHTKFADGTAGHEVRVHQLLQNRRGWLVALPFEYKGEQITQQTVDSTQPFDAADIAGHYRLLRHTYRQDETQKSYSVPTRIVLGTDGSISGDGINAATSGWSLVEGTSHIDVRLNGATHSGVVVWQTADRSTRRSLSIAAVSDASGTTGTTRSVTLWATQYDPSSIVVGSEDNTTAWWTAFSDYYTIGPNESVTVRFTNHSNRVENWNNYLAVVTNDAARGTGGYTEYAVVRADGYAWQGAKNTLNDQTWYTSNANNYDFSTFKDDMDGASVVLTARRDGTQVTIHADIVTTTGKSLWQEFRLTAGTASQPMRLFLTADGSHIVIDDTQNAPSGIEEAEIDKTQTRNYVYDITGRRVAEPRQGLNVVDGHIIYIK